MRNKLFFIFNVTFIIGLLTAGCAGLPGINPLDNLTGVWEGSYTGANQGETGLTLTVFKEEENYKAIFHFYNLPGRTNVREGRYYMNVSYNEETGKYLFSAYEWIERPSNYTWGNLEGELSGNVFSGSVTVNNYRSGIDFRVVRNSEAVR